MGAGCPGIFWLLLRVEAWVCSDLPASSGFRSLAAEFNPAGRALASSGSDVVAVAFGGVSGALAVAAPESDAVANDALLFHQQLLRGADRRGLSALFPSRCGTLRKHA